MTTNFVVIQRPVLMQLKINDVSVIFRFVVQILSNVIYYFRGQCLKVVAEAFYQ